MSSFCIVLLAAACAGAPGPVDPTPSPMTPVRTPTSAGPITRERAIEVAIQACHLPHLVLVSVPRNIRARLTTLDQASSGESTRYGQPVTTTVWLVQMDGQLQIIGGPMPNPTELTITVAPPTPFAGTCTALIDANTGDLLETRGQPLVTAP